jgi:hypothetical protein
MAFKVIVDTPDEPVEPVDAVSDTVDTPLQADEEPIKPL